MSPKFLKNEPDLIAIAMGVLDAGRIGLGLQAFVRVQLSRHDHDAIARFAELVRAMVEADYAAARRDSLVKQAGFKAYDYNE